MPAGNHRNVIAWQRAMDLAVSVYSLDRPLRNRRHSDLASQLVRAVASIPLNIAEGKGRNSDREFARFLDIAMGSLREVETLVELIARLRLAKASTAAELLRQCDEVGRVLHGLRRRARIAPEMPTPSADADS